MFLSRIDTLILRRLPRQNTEWVQFPVHDESCIQAMELLVRSGAVERRAAMNWAHQGRSVQGYGLVVGDWEGLSRRFPAVGLALDPSEARQCFIRITPLGIRLREDLFSSESTMTQTHALEFIKHMPAPGLIRLYLDSLLTIEARPQPFPDGPQPADPRHYKNLNH